VRSLRTGQVQREGYGDEHILGTYVHGHWAETPGIPEAFVAACVAAKS
jgi:cobyrinic acid a,c-diamide synthase